MAKPTFAPSLIRTWGLREVTEYLICDSEFWAYVMAVLIRNIRSMRRKAVMVR
jgi:hypothetical protein